MTQYQHWKCDTDSDNILWLTIDRQGASVNSMNREVFTELNAILDDIQENTPRGVIIRSGKKKGFIAGADITQFTSLETSAEAFDLIRSAQLVLDKLEALTCPTVAMINGFCLGGGTELSLACTYRVAEESKSTRIGLPEIKLGIHPGWGGTVRLPRLVGAIESMKMILPGAAYPAKKAAKVGIVDAAVPLRELERAARYYILKTPKPHKPKGLAAISNTSLVRPLLGKVFYKNLSAKHVSKRHYPAPFAVIANWIRVGVKGDRAMLAEAKSIAKLMVHPTARNLVRVFFLQERMKGLAKTIKFEPAHIHVIGAGTMGGDIAAWCAYKGMYVTLQDRTPEQIAPAIKRAYRLFKKRLREPRLIQAVMDRLQPDIEGLGVKRADVVIEAVFENLEVKQKIFAELEPQLKSGAVLATNTSSIPLEEIATVLQNPARLVGIHFFNPVSMMPLVEVVRGTQTAENTLHKALSFVGKLSRLPLPVASKPGFLVNRVLMPYLMEAMALYEEGYSAEIIDKAALKFGMPMGPVTLADTVGLDVCLSVAENLSQHFGGTVPEKLQEMVKAGHLGKKTGRGFYVYKHGEKVRPTKTTESIKSTKGLADRMVLRMVNEAVACLHEHIVEDADLLDGGMIFGTGFAPFRGGPIQYAKTRGIKVILSELEWLEKEYGDRFKPVMGWDAITENPEDIVVPGVEELVQRPKTNGAGVENQDKE